MDMLLKELKDENTEATHDEETAQKAHPRRGLEEGRVRLLRQAKG